VTEFYVFGSYARGALVVGDIDVAVEYEADEQRRLLEYTRLSYGQNPRGDLNHAIFGGQRIFQPHYGQKEALEREVGGLVLLWRRGDTVAQALTRLRKLKPDPAAQRAARDPVVPELEGLDRRIPRGIRNQLSEATKTGAIDVRRVQLEDARPRSRAARTSIEERWGPNNPMRRAALAAAAYLEERGFGATNADAPSWGALASRRGRVTVGLTAAHLFVALDYFAQGSGELWLQVVNPSRRPPLEALIITEPRRVDANR